MYPELLGLSIPGVSEKKKEEKKREKASAVARYPETTSPT